MHVNPYLNYSADRFARNSGRHLSGDAIGVVKYPSPFFDIAHLYMPSSQRELLEYCAYFFRTNPLVNAVCFKMAEYPITDLIIDSIDVRQSKKWHGFLYKTIKIKKLQVEIGLDYNTFGNAFLSVSFPFHKYLVCKSCGSSKRAENQKYAFRNNGFHGTCSKCGASGEFRVRDLYIKSERDIRVIRWSPLNMTIRYNHATGETSYFYRVPGDLANDIRMGKRHVIEKTPQIFIEAVKQNKAIVFNSKNLFHLRRPNISGQSDAGWGLPMAEPVLKDTYYLNILRKAQEAIAIEHIVPMRIFFPSVNTGTSDPYATMNLTNWKRQVEAEIVRWRLDNNYTPIFPVPIGTETIGGDGRALLLTQEYRVWQEAICAGMQVPIEFVFGGMQYSGSNVSLKMLENHFSHYRADQIAFLEDFLIPMVAAYLDWTPINVHFRAFKMADDLQRNAYNLQLHQAGKISAESLLESSDWNATAEKERIASELAGDMELQRRQALSQARIQAQAQTVIGRSQMAMQQEQMNQQMASGVPGVASPGAQGAGALNDQATANLTGQFAPAAGGGAPAPSPIASAESPLNADQNLGFSTQQAAAPNAPITLDIRMVAQKMAAWLDQQPDAQKVAHLETLKMQNPHLHRLVAAELQVRQGAHQTSAAMPAPPVKPPRRGPEAKSV